MNEPHVAVGSHHAAAHAPTGPLATTVAVAGSLYHLKFRFKNPLTDAFAPFPAGLQLLLFNGGAQAGATITLDAQGYGALPFPRATAAQLAHPNRLRDYLFKVRCPVRSYINLGSGACVRADSLGLTDTRNLFELPLQMSTLDRNFTNDVIPRFTNGQFHNYAGNGEGTASAPLLFTLNLHWYPLQFRFFNHTLRVMSQVPRGMSVQSRLGGKTPPEAMEDLDFVGNFDAVTTVRGFQQRLTWLGFYTGPIDGNDSDALRTSVGNFQARHGAASNGAQDAATQGLMDEAFYRRRVGVMRDNTYLVPVLAKHPVHTEVHFQAMHDDHWVYSANDSATPAIVKRVRAEVDALDPADRFKYYDLPNHWNSDGGVFRTDNNITHIARWQILPARLHCYPSGTSVLPTDQPFLVMLDDMVLMHNATHLETVGADDRYSIFDLTGEVIEEDPADPYYSVSHNEGVNYFPCEEAGGFAVYTQGKYYFANRTRVPANLRRAGMRAAVLNAHPHRAISEPAVSGAGNIEQNYFHAVDYRNSKVISYLIVFWSCKFRRHHSIHGVDDIRTVDQGIVDFRREGLTNAKKRHEEPNHEIVDNADISPHLTKVVRHFVHWDNLHAKCTVKVFIQSNPHNLVRADMSLTSANFDNTIWQAEQGGWATAAGEFVAAHEVGHATGLDDDYIEAPGAWIDDGGWIDPVIPRFAQFVKGNPFGEDSSGLMTSNNQFRHRMLFHHVDWMNSDPAIRNLTGELRFKAKTANYQYYLPPVQDRNFLTAATRAIQYMPVISANRVANGAHGLMDYTLYKLGKDRTTRVIVPGQDFDSMLVVSLYIKWSFHNTSTTHWTTAEKVRFIKAKYTDITNPFNAKKYLSAAAADSAWFQKIYLLFRLHFHEGGNSEDNEVLNGTGHIAPHFTITAHITHPGHAVHAPSYHTANFHGTSFSVDQASDSIPWFRYMLGLDPVTITPAAVAGQPATVTEITTVSNADLDFIRVWANATLGAAAIGANYRIQDF